ncbi:MAG: radical SAM protein [Sedimentisphaerales bacterium]|nr:radical SAM protein [Sedimentisphaerales bacterium]
MKILMLNPPYVDDFCRSARWAAKSRGRVQRHPDWMLIATAVLENAGHNVKFTDGAALNLKKNDIELQLKHFKPEMVVLHTTTPSIYNDISYARLAKQSSGAISVLIGPHVTAMPENTFEIAEGDVDIIARKEYDFTLRDIAQAIPTEEIGGISYLKNGVVHHNEDRPLLDVNELPFPAWHHIKPEWYRDAGKRFPFLTLISCRGCFGRCTFCRDASIMYGRKLRFRNPEAVVDEIEYDFKLFPYIKEIMFETDTFSASAAQVNSTCEEILRRNLKVTWSCNTRVDLDLSVLPLMKKAGCRMLMVGFEFGTQEALDAVKKGITLEQSRKFAEAAHAMGFIIHGCFMIGAPGETKESARKTIDFAKSLPMDTVQFSGICVYPGTPMYDWATENDYLVPKDWNQWVTENYEQATLLSYPQFSKEDIDAYIDKGLKEFYFRPKQIAKMIANIKSPSDLKRKIFGFKSLCNYIRKGQQDGAAKT